MVVESLARFQRTRLLLEPNLVTHILFLRRFLFIMMSYTNSNLSQFQKVLTHSSLRHKNRGSKLILELSMPFYLLACFIHRSTLILPLRLYFVPTIPSRPAPPIRISPSSAPNTFIFISANLLFNFSVSVLSVQAPTQSSPSTSNPPVCLSSRSQSNAPP